MRNMYGREGEELFPKLERRRGGRKGFVTPVLKEGWQRRGRKAKIANAILVDKILLTGRAMGIHLIFATQGLSGNVDRSIVQNIPIRIIFGVVETQSMNFLGNSAATNLIPGKAIVNYNNGQKEDNISVTMDNL